MRAMATQDGVRVEQDGTTLWVTLDRPDVRNALSRAVNLRLQAVAADAAARDDVHAVVLTGAGDKAFCAGADLKERRGVPPSESLSFVNAIGGAINAFGDLRKPTICMMNGSAYGGGLELALACDFRVCVDSAHMALTEVRLGIMPGAGGTQRLPRIIGEARAKEMILLGRRIGAVQAYEWGLVNHVASRDKLRAAVDAILGELALGASLSVTSSKSAIERGAGRSIKEGLAIERECYEVTLFSEDREEGLAAFAEGRPPHYRGR
jgi:enoyl-CoA hydratase/carnithine racemase